MSVSFGKRVLPTKIELIRLRRGLAVAEKVHKILEDKRQVLLKRLDEVIEMAREARETSWQPLSEAYYALYGAYLKLGPTKLEGVATTIPPRVEVTVNVRKVVDVDVPLLQVKEGEAEGPPYGFGDTVVELDEATSKMRRILPPLCKAAELENAIFRLAAELERTQRLINALEYIVIPHYQQSIKYISSVLEEGMREEFIRMKKVKAVIIRRRGEAL